jgi:hypothetical protein
MADLVKFQDRQYSLDERRDKKVRFWRNVYIYFAVKSPENICFQGFFGLFYG